MTAAAALLDQDEPPPYERFNPEGAAPILLICDHASRRVPRRLHDLGLSAASCRDTSVGTSAPPTSPVTWRCGWARRSWPAIPDSWSIATGTSTTSLPPVSDGTAIPGNATLAPADRQARTDALYEPTTGQSRSARCVRRPRHRADPAGDP
jgi:hypothetical protein